MARPSHGWVFAWISSAKLSKRLDSVAVPLEEELRVINAATFKDTVN